MDSVLLKKPVKRKEGRESTWFKQIVFTRSAGGYLLIESPEMFRVCCSHELTGCSIQEHNQLLSTKIVTLLFTSSPNGTKDSAFIEKMASSFNADFLHQHPSQGGIIPLEQIDQWFHRKFGQDETVSSVSTNCNEVKYFTGHTDDVAELSFETYGLVCQRHDDGHPVLNIQFPVNHCMGSSMDWRGSQEQKDLLSSSVVSRLVSSLAVIHLTKITHPVFSRLRTAFLRDFLHTMPSEGGQIPRDVLECWLQRNLFPIVDFTPKSYSSLL